MTADLLYEVRDQIATITLNRPGAMNATTPDMRDGLIDATFRAETDDRVRAVLIRGAGDHFMAGGNLQEFRDRMDADPDAHAAGAEQRALNVHLAILRLRRMRKPVLTAVQGAVAGMGASIMLASDLVIAADNAYFALAFTRIGLPGDCGVTYHLPRIVGERRALELMLLGGKFTVEQAKEYGIVTRIVPRDTLDSEATALARRLADGPTIGLGLAKTLIRQSFDVTLEQQLFAEAESAAAAARTDDHREGVVAFLDRRDPIFRGS